MQGGNRQPMIVEHEIPQIVSVRKYPVDIALLCETLRQAKMKSNKTINEIAKALDVPKTMVDHWFRKDDSFAIPDPNIWLKLKAFLNIETDSFDASILTFEKKESSFEQGNRVYSLEGLSPILTCTKADISIIDDTYKNRPAREYFEVSPTLRAQQQGFKVKEATKQEVKNDE